MKVLITGSKGQIGCCLCKQIQSLPDIDLLALDRKSLDITSENDVLRVVQEFLPNVIINAAAYTAVDKAESETELSFDINCNGAKYLAQAAESIGSTILHISTDYVFSGYKDGLYNETDIANPQGVYGKSKLAGELAVLNSCTRSIILRTAWVFGEDGNNFVKTMLRIAKQKEELSIVTDQYGGPTYAGDIAEALITIAKDIFEQGNHFDPLKFGIYHFSGLPHISWYHFAETIFNEAIKQKILTRLPIIKEIKTIEYPTSAKRPMNSKLDTKKITNTFAIEASDWRIALNKLAKYE